MRFKAVIAGVGMGLLTTCLALTLAGGGHGINWAVMTATSLILAPLAFVAFVRRATPRKSLALGLVIVAAVMDLILVSTIVSEGTFGRVWVALPSVLILWTICWSTWQIAAVAALLAPHERPC